MRRGKVTSEITSSDLIYNLPLTLQVLIWSQDCPHDICQRPREASLFCSGRLALTKTAISDFGETAINVDGVKSRNPEKWRE